MLMNAAACQVRSSALILTNTQTGTSDSVDNREVPSDLRLVDGEMRGARALGTLLVQKLQVLLLGELGGLGIGARGAGISGGKSKAGGNLGNGRDGGTKANSAKRCRSGQVQSNQGSSGQHCRLRNGDVRMVEKRVVASQPASQPTSAGSRRRGLDRPKEERAPEASDL